MLREIPIVAADALFAPPFWARLDLEDETVGVAGTQPLEICSEVSHGNVSAAALAFGARLQISPEKALPNENHLAIEVQMFFLQSKRFGDAKRTEEARTAHYTQIVSQYREESAESGRRRACAFRAPMRGARREQSGRDSVLYTGPILLHD